MGMDTALGKKLKLKPGARAAVVGGPDGYAERIGAADGGAIGDPLEGPLDWIQVFVRTAAELSAAMPTVRAALDADGLLWLSYPKGSSKVQTDLTRGRGWDAVKDADLMWLGLVSIDETWSAFSLRPYKPGEARQTFR